MIAQKKAEKHEQEMMKAMGQGGGEKVKPIMEINPKHGIIKKIHKLKKGKAFDDAVHLLYDQALMLPVLSQTSKRKYVSEICYTYNINSVSVDDRDWAEMCQISTINLVRSRGLIR